MRRWLAVLPLLFVGACAVDRGAQDDDDDVVDDDDDTTLPPADDLHGEIPEAPLGLLDFVATSDDGTERTEVDLLGHPTVMWFFPFAGTPV